MNKILKEFILCVCGMCLGSAVSCLVFRKDGNLSESWSSSSRDTESGHRNNPPTGSGALLGIAKTRNLLKFAAECRAAASDNPETFANKLQEQTKKLSLRELETALWSLSQHRPDLAAAIVADLKNPSLSVKFSDTVVSGVRFDNRKMLDEIMDILHLPATKRRDLTENKLADWAENDPYWATTRLRELPPSSSEKLMVLKGLARTDPTQALALGKAESLTPKGMASILLEASETNCAEAMHLADQIKEGPEAAIFLYSLMYKNPKQFSNQEFSALAESVRKFGNPVESGPYYGSLMRTEAIKQLSAAVPNEAIALFEDMPESGPRNQLIPTVALAASDGDWRKALDWIKDSQEDGRRSAESIYSPFAWSWVLNDPNGMQAALTADPDMPQAKMMLRTLDLQHRQEGKENYENWRKNAPDSLQKIFSELDVK